jgi:hypothetical protein
VVGGVDLRITHWTIIYELCGVVEKVCSAVIAADVLSCMKTTWNQARKFLIWAIIVLAALEGLVLGSILVVKFILARDVSSAHPCVNTLRQIEAASQQFALENKLTNGAPIRFPEDLTNYIKLNSLGKIPPCPSGGTYQISKVGEPPTCSLDTNIVPAHVLP